MNVCVHCHSQKIVFLNSGNDPMHCIGCGGSLCNECYAKSIKLFGFVGDCNDLFPVEKRVPSSTCTSWPYREYYPANYGVYLMSRGCVSCGPKG